MTQPKALQKQDLLRYSKRIFQCDPSEEAQKLFHAFPTKRGFGLSPAEGKVLARFEAATVVAIAEAHANPLAKVLYFVPKPLQEWAVENIRVVAKTMFGQITKAKHDPNVPTIKTSEDIRRVKDLYKRIFGQIGIDIYPTSIPPTYWVGYGFMSQDPRLPDWLRDGLL